MGRNKEQAARMLGHLVSTASRLIRPYMEPILKVSCQTEAPISNPSPPVAWYGNPPPPPYDQGRRKELFKGRGALNGICQKGSFCTDLLPKTLYRKWIMLFLLMAKTAGGQQRLCELLNILSEA